MAVSLTHDIISHCISRGSTVYTCSLDAEGAFDAIPHVILFKKAMGFIPDIYWRLLVTWYSSITVKVKLNGQISQSMRILKGTRQGGMSSHFLFNLFDQDMIDILNNMNCGISINDNNYNVRCYADDVLLTSVTSTGLQLLIDTANSYITSHGLRFNPDKTKCAVFGKQMLTRQSEMADLARRATRWVGTFPYILTPIPNLYDHSFPRYGQITFLTFRRPTTLTFDLKF